MHHQIHFYMTIISLCFDEFHIQLFIFPEMEFRFPSPVFCDTLIRMRGPYFVSSDKIEATDRGK